MKTKFGKFDFSSGQEKYNEGLLLGLLLGTAIGACAAILFTPKSGKSLRKKIREEAGDLGKHWDNLKNKAEGVANEAKDKFNEAGGQAKTKVNNYADKAADAVREGEETLKEEF